MEDKDTPREAEAKGVVALLIGHRTEEMTKIIFNVLTEYQNERDSLLLEVRKMVEEKNALIKENQQLIDGIYATETIKNLEFDKRELIEVLKQTKKLTMGPSFELQDAIMCNVLEAIRKHTPQQRENKDD